MTRPTVQMRHLPHGEGLPVPRPQTEGAAGMDLTAALPADGPLTLAPGDRTAIPTGLEMAIPQGYEGQVRPRSGLALKQGLTVLNAPGTIDSDYRGEVMVLLTNFSDQDYSIHRGDRIAQLVIARYERIEWKECDKLPDSRRGSGGFGHSGK